MRRVEEIRKRDRRDSFMNSGPCDFRSAIHDRHFLLKMVDALANLLEDGEVCAIPDDSPLHDACKSKTSCDVCYLEWADEQASEVSGE